MRKKLLDGNTLSVKRHSSPYTTLGRLHRAAGKEEGKSGCVLNMGEIRNIHPSMSIHFPAELNWLTDEKYVLVRQYSSLWVEISSNFELAVVKRRPGDCVVLRADGWIGRLDERWGGEKRSTRTEFSLRDWQTKQKKNKTFLDYVVQKRNPHENFFNNDVQDTHYQVKFGYRTGWNQNYFPFLEVERGERAKDEFFFHRSSFWHFDIMMKIGRWTKTPQKQHTFSILVYLFCI